MWRNPQSAFLAKICMLAYREAENKCRRKANFMIRKGICDVCSFAWAFNLGKGLVEMLRKRAWDPSCQT